MSYNESDWEEKQEYEEITVAQFDSAIKDLRAAKIVAAASKKIHENDKATAYECEKFVMDLLERSGKKEYVCDGFGRAKLNTKMSVKTPKTPEEKQAFFQWVLTEKGQDAYYAYMSVNSATLNRLYGEMNEEAAAKGEVLDMGGIEPPTAYNKLSFTSA